ncbi:MAG TPA: hypothetical protein VFK54_03250 [Candidatus Limnocylindrales bacterium]|nr:hypothetical protein [Candidatus Limnocylindrales bacterium]
MTRRTDPTPPAAAKVRAPATAEPTREQLLEQHAEARRRRNAAPLGSEAWAEASAEVGRIEVEIARIERAMDPPRV